MVDVLFSLSECVLLCVLFVLFKCHLSAIYTYICYVVFKSFTVMIQYLALMVITGSQYYIYTNDVYIKYNTFLWWVYKEIVVVVVHLQWTIMRRTF